MDASRQYNLVSLSPNGVERFRRTINAIPTAAYGGRLAAVPEPVDGGVPSASAFSCLDGSPFARLDLRGITTEPVLSVFDGAVGYSIAVTDAGALYGDCNDSMTPFSLFSWELTSGAMKFHIPVGPYFSSDGRPSTVTMLEDRSVLMGDWRINCLADGGADETWSTSLRRVAPGGETVFSCPVVGTIGPYLPLTNERWVTISNPVDHSVIQAFDLPGVKAIAHGWMTVGGNPGGGDRPR